MLPAALATGSSIMPHKRNPDLFELTRGRAAALEGDLAAVLQIKSRLGGGYHRDFQLLKEPLLRGLDRGEAMLAALHLAVPRLGVDRARCAAALAGGALATDEVMRRVEEGRRSGSPTGMWPRRSSAGESFPAPSTSRIVARRRSTGGLGDLGLDRAGSRVRQARRWGERERSAIRSSDGAARGPEIVPMTADRRKRHLKILELISTRAVHTQEELAEALSAEGWEVTQSSVSRDIAALRLVKADGAYRRPPRGSHAQDPDERRIADGVLTSEPAGDALVVLHTPPGEANRVAVAVDRLAWPDVVGTLAGDDTIFLAVKDRVAQRRVLREVRRLTDR